MTLIFNEEGLKEVVYPCVVQTFVNHNAALYKLFVIGQSYTTVLRPSIKNFYDCEGMFQSNYLKRCVQYFFIYLI